MILLSNPLPSGISWASDPPPPWNFQFPPWWRSGYFLEPHIWEIIADVNVLAKYCTCMYITNNKYTLIFFYDFKTCGWTKSICSRNFHSSPNVVANQCKWMAALQNGAWDMFCLKIQNAPTTFQLPMVTACITWTRKNPLCNQNSWSELQLSSCTAF